MTTKTTKKWIKPIKIFLGGLLLFIYLLASCQLEKLPNIFVTIEPSKPPEQPTIKIITDVQVPQPPSPMIPTITQPATPHIPSSPLATNTLEKPIMTPSLVPFVLPKPLLIAFIGVDIRRVDSLRPDPTVIADSTIYPRLYTIYSDGTELKALVDFPISPNALAWAPDGYQLAFASLGNHTNIFVISTNEPEPKQITNFQQDVDVYFMAWSPDGKQIVFDTHDGIYLLDVEGGHTYFLVSGKTPDWSSDGEFIIFEQYPDLYKIRLDGSGLTCLTCEIEGAAHSLQWGFHSGRMIFRLQGAFWIMDENGQNKQLLAQPLFTTLPSHILAPVPFTEFEKEYLLYGTPTGEGVHLVDTANLRVIRLGNWQINPLAILTARIQP